MLHEDGAEAGEVDSAPLTSGTVAGEVDSAAFTAPPVPNPDEPSTEAAICKMVVRILAFRCVSAKQASFQLCK
jgi:hypothetical protein